MKHNILIAFIFLMLSTSATPAGPAGTGNTRVGFNSGNGDANGSVTRPADKLIVVSSITSPMLVTYDAHGKLEGVSYDRIGAVLLNAFTEQQFRIKLQDDENKILLEQIKKLQAEIEALRSFVICRTSMRPELCGELER